MLSSQTLGRHEEGTCGHENSSPKKGPVPPTGEPRRDANSVESSECSVRVPISESPRERKPAAQETAVQRGGDVVTIVTLLVRLSRRSEAQRLSTPTSRSAVTSPVWPSGSFF